MSLYSRKDRNEKRRGKGIWMLPLPARPLVLLTFIGYGSYLPPWERWCQSSVSRPMEAKEAKAASAVATQDFTWDSKFEQGEPADGPHLVARVSVVWFIVRLMHW